MWASRAPSPSPLGNCTAEFQARLPPQPRTLLSPSPPAKDSRPRGKEAPVPIQEWKHFWPGSGCWGLGWGSGLGAQGSSPAVSCRLPGLHGPPHSGAGWSRPMSFRQKAFPTQGGLPGEGEGTPNTPAAETPAVHRQPAPRWPWGAGGMGGGGDAICPWSPAAQGGFWPWAGPSPEAPHQPGSRHRMHANSHHKGQCPRPGCRSGYLFLLCF